MTNEEVARLVELVAARLAQRQGWLPTPTRPEPPAGPTPGSLPSYAGSAQSLSDIAPSRRGGATPKHRPDYHALVVAARQAAAATGPAPLPGGSVTGADRQSSKTTRRDVSIGVSNRHLHLAPQDFETLFGKGQAPTVKRAITQPGQYAANETVTLVGSTGRIEGVRVVGPARGTTQVELSPADAATLGVNAPVRVSGKLDHSGGLTLEGPAGKVTLGSGVIVAQRHLHVAPPDAKRLGVADGDKAAVECGPAGRRVTLHDVIVRMGPAHATELHLDLDEANAAGVKTGDVAAIVATTPSQAPGRRRPLLTERDVAMMAARGETVSAHGPYLLTPAARDRARAMGIWKGDM